ncbi:MAG: hypothetical protein KBT27_02405 [Prevotellaceae bacterium]|nr:hypothetical protein [Candidatus Faecinaster equi]
MLISKLSHRGIGIFAGILLIVIYYVPFMIMGDLSYITIHDNLDGYWANVVTQARFLKGETNGIFPIMDESFCHQTLPDWINLKIFLLLLFRPFTAYLINDCIVRVIAYLFMFLVLYDDILIKSKYALLIAILSAVVFTIMPTYTVFGLTSSAIPMVMWVICNIKKGEKVGLSWLLILLLPLVSTIALTGFYICFAMGMYAIWMLIRQEKKVGQIFLLTFILGVEYLIVNFPLLLSFTASDYVSHRVEFHIVSSWKDILSEMKTFLFHCQYHYGTLETKWIMIIALFGLVCSRMRNRRLLCALCGILNVLVFVFMCAVAKKMVPSFSLLQSVQFDRFYIFLPVLWVCVLAIGIENMMEWHIFRELGVGLLIILMCVTAFQNKELVYTVKECFGRDVKNPNYSQYYDSNLFNRLHELLGDSALYETKVVSVGMTPAVTMYNGFFTLDSYQSNYSLGYKKKFRKVIEKELDKNGGLKWYFDDWGGRCYVFSNELGREYNISKNSTKLICLELNYKILAEMECEYIISAVPILMKDEQIRLFLELDMPQSYRHLYVYKL